MMRAAGGCRGTGAPLAPLLLTALLALGGCREAGEQAQGSPHGSEPHGSDPQESAVVEAAAHAAEPGTEAPAADLTPPALAAVRSAPVQGHTGPGGEPFDVVVRDPGRAGHDRLIGRRNFQISLRDGGDRDYQCGSCHRPTEPTLRPERAEDAHRNVLPRHPDQAGSPCQTCHAPGRVEELALVSGERVPLSHAYRLCGQCHYPQADAWAAGAHGKRLDGWRGRRVVMGCADCHDPHEPAVKPRIPFPGPRPPGGAKAP